ncbi:hypothetical protein DFH29DRAFT_1007045 [Suillus ampliporus]|nr:hypothetical protein DFH29DRAFT_1007045 [Suillus ampliporus]
MPGSSSKAKKMERKALDSDPKMLEGQAGLGQRSRAQASLQPPTDVNNSQPRCAILDAPAWTSQPKGTTSLTSNFPLNPLAPEPSHKGCGSRSKYGFAPPIIPPGTEPDLQALNNSFVAAAKGVSEQCALSASHDSRLVAANALEHRLPAAASSDLSQQVLSEPSIVNLSDAQFHENLDPILQPINHGDQRNLGPQGTDSEHSDASMESSDVEDTSDGDEDSVDRQIGWGEAGGCRDTHPGFSEEVQPSQPWVAIALPSDFKFQHSRDEDDHAAGRSLAFSNVSSSDDLEMDAPQLMSCNFTIRKMGIPAFPILPFWTSSMVPEMVNKPGSTNATKASKDLGDGPKSTQLAWYGPRWKHFLEEAKGECCALHALENAFLKLVPDLSTTVTESLSASLVEWLKDGNQVEADVWPAHKPDMARLLYDDLSTWRSDLKKIVIAITPSLYSLIPPANLPAQEHANWVEAAAANLLDKLAYLHDGKDELGKTRNFAHPALGEATILFLYVGSYHITHRRPDIFCKQVPLNSIVSLMASKKGNGKSYPNFSSKDYLPIYNGMLKLLNNKLMKDPYHSPKLVRQLCEWAKAGWAQSCKLNSNNTSKHTHLQIELD